MNMIAIFHHSTPYIQTQEDVFSSCIHNAACAIRWQAKKEGMNALSDNVIDYLATWIACHKLGHHFDDKKYFASPPRHSHPIGRWKPYLEHGQYIARYCIKGRR